MEIAEASIPLQGAEEESGKVGEGGEGEEKDPGEGGWGKRVLKVV